jgi:hypothetical protein
MEFSYLNLCIFSVSKYQKLQNFIIFNIYHLDNPKNKSRKYLLLLLLFHYLYHHYVIYLDVKQKELIVNAQHVKMDI